MKTEAATFDDLRRRGNELADAGRYREAIELLTAANRQRRDPRLERKLIRYRRAAPVLETPVGRPDWPPPLADPFPGITGRLPEVSPAELSADLVGGGIQHHGAVAARGLIPSSDARALAATIDRVFTDFDHWADQRDGEGAEASGPEGHFVPFSARRHERREWVRNSGAIWVADSPSAAFELFELLSAVQVPELVRAHFGEEPTLSTNKFTLRRVEATRPATWHQDGSFLGGHVRALNLWLCLTRCGHDVHDVPGLDVVPRRIDLLETGGDGAWVNNAISPYYVKEHFGDEILRPAFEPGDALFFDERFLHKTGSSRGMSRPRHAVETWFFAPSSFPRNYRPFAS